MVERGPSEFPECVEENRRIWDANARWWDDQIGDGNAFQDVLIEPATERLLAVQSGESILDVACGAGRLTRRLARLGARVTGIDGSERFIERARRRTAADDVAVEFRVMDACDERAMRALGERSFDRAVCTMALMDMPCIEPMMRALGRLLKPGGCFVFSVIHPCFVSAGVQRFVEAGEDEAGRQRVQKGVKIREYLTPGAKKTEGILGQPEPQYYFHRPLHVLLGVSFRAGFVVEALEEPAFPAEMAETEGLRLIDMVEIPPVLVVGMRLRAGE